MRFSKLNPMYRIVCGLYIKNFTYEELHSEYNKTRLEQDPDYSCMSRATFARRIKDLKTKQMITEGKIKDLHGKNCFGIFPTGRLQD